MNVGCQWKADAGCRIPDAGCVGAKGLRQLQPLAYGTRRERPSAPALEPATGIRHPASGIKHPPASCRSGQAVTEFALLYTGAVLPLTFMVVFVAQMLWIWHSVADFTRDGARYAATHCWQADGNAGNVLQYMQSHVPLMIDMDQFQNNSAGIQVQYFTEGPDGSLGPLNTDCSGCLPDAVSVSITAYQYKRFSSFFRLPNVTIPPFTTTVPMESGGLQDASGTCVP